MKYFISPFIKISVGITGTGVRGEGSDNLACLGEKENLGATRRQGATTFIRRGRRFSRLSTLRREGNLQMSVARGIWFFDGSPSLLLVQLLFDFS